MAEQGQACGSTECDEDNFKTDTDFCSSHQSGVVESENSNSSNPSSVDMFATPPTGCSEEARTEMLNASENSKSVCTVQCNEPMENNETLKDFNSLIITEFEEFSDRIKSCVEQFDKMHDERIEDVGDFERLSITEGGDLSDISFNPDELPQTVLTCSSGSTGNTCDNPMHYSGCEMWRSINGRTYEKIWVQPKCMQISSHESNVNYFEFLPVELIVSIFSYLSTQELCRHVSTVCRKWRQISLDQSLWKHIDFSSSPDISSLNLLWIVRRTPLLQRLNLRGRSFIKRAEVAIFTECCPGLQEIDFGFCDGLTSDMIKMVSENCKGIRKLNVEKCEKLDYRAIRYISRCKKLTHLNFSHCRLQDSSVKYMANHLNNITSINLDGIAYLTDSAVEALVSKHADHLLELELDGEEISDISMEQIAKCRNLRLLGLSFCECLTDQALVFLKSLRNLETLRLRKGADFSAQGLASFFKDAYFGKLLSLNLTECSNILDDTVLNIVKCCGKSLRELSLGWCWFVTDTGLISIVDHCSHLESLDLLGMDKIQGESLERIPEEMPYLKLLDLKQCNQINDTLIMDVVRRKPDLEVYNYYGERFVYQ